MPKGTTIIANNSSIKKRDRSMCSTDRPGGSIRPELSGASAVIAHTLAHAPWALITSLSIGLANYAIVIIVSKFYGLATGGQFRLMLSVFGMLSLFCLADSGKVLIKHLVQGEAGVARTLLLQRLRWSLIAVLLGVGVAGYFYANNNEIWFLLLIGSLCIPFIHPATLFMQINQAQKQFRLNAFYTVTKWSSITLVVAIMATQKVNFVWMMSTYLVLSALFNITFLSWHREVFEPETERAPDYRRANLQLSGSGVFPALLDHADKFLVSYFFGLEALGIYVIGVSTGRLLLNVIKPTMSVYFPLLVKNRFRLSLQLIAFLVLSLVGLVAALLMYYYFDRILGEGYVAAYPLAATVVAGLGIYFVGTLRYYSAVYHKDSTPRVPAISNIFVSLIVVLYMLVVLQFGGTYALLLCAASYPLRELLRAIMISFLAADANRAAPAVAAT